MNKLKIALIIFITILATAPAICSPDKKTEALVNRIMQDRDTYVFGDATGSNPDEAYQAAVAAMLRSISTTVSSRTSWNISETTGSDGTTDSHDEFSTMVESYTAAMELNDLEIVPLETKGNFHTFVYMKREQLNKVFAKRRGAIGALVRDAMEGIELGKIDNALRYLYRAYALLNSVPDGDALEDIVNKSGDRRLLSTWIPETMRDICRKVRFGIADVHDTDGGGKSLDLTVTFDGKPVASIDFTYQNGMGGRSACYTAKDGTVHVELDPKTRISPLYLNIEYKYDNESHSIPGYAPVLRSFKPGNFLNNAYIYALNEDGKGLKAGKEDHKALIASLSDHPEDGVSPIDKRDTKEMAAAMAGIIKAISSRQYDDARAYFTEEGYSMYCDLIKYGNARVMGKAGRETYDFYPMLSRTVCRSIPMSFSFDKGRREFKEDVTFTFDSLGKIESLAFSLDRKASSDVFSRRGRAWSDYKKMVLVTFLENYRTAFALKRLDFIEGVFADDATIIVGHKVVPDTRIKRTSSGDLNGLQFSNKADYTYSQKSKQEYLRQLAKVFDSQEYINIRFGSTEVERIAADEMTFGMQMKQDYVSATYGDEGYLYLMVDFNEPDKPSIKIRTWQPERNPDLTPNIPATSPYYGIFSTGYFEADTLVDP